MSNFEKSVKGGTKVKLAPPKSKYVEHILVATQSGEAGVAEVFRTLIHRLRDSTWTVAFKSLIIVHLMIKEGAPDVTLRYLAIAPRSRLAVNSFTDVQTQGANIRRYSEYLLERATSFASTQCDYVRSGEAKVKRLTVDKGLLRETEEVQEQVKALVKCDLLTNDIENEITLTAFRLLTRDLLDLYNVENEAVMKVLSFYFEMSKPDAERAVIIYKTFCKQTDQVVQFLGVARQYQHATRLEIPKIRHAPTSLANSLQEYLDDKNFDINRRQYLAEQDAKRNGHAAPKPTLTSSSQPKTQAAQPRPQTSTAPAAATAQSAPRGPAPDLIDFFESIEQNQQPMAQNPPQFQQQQQSTGYAVQAQPTGYYPPQQQPGFVPQQQQMTGYPQQSQTQPTGPNGFDASNTNPFGQPQPQQVSQPQPLQTQFTGAGFGGYGPQPPQQQQSFITGNGFVQSPIQSPPVQTPQSLQTQQTGSTNPFRQSMMPTGGPAASFGSSIGSGGLQRQGTNPFARSTQSTPAAFSQPPQPQQDAFSPQQHQQPQALQPQATGTNPFARNIPPSQQPTPPTSPPNALQVQPTGSTNPFRQSAFVNQQTGQGWQNAPQASMGGLEHLETVPVFPRPGQQQQQPQQSPWG